MTIIYRTTGPWGGGAGANLSAAQVDGNFYDLDGRVEFMELNPPEPVQIESFSAVGDQFYIYMSDGTTQGPLALPVVAWNFRGPWLDATEYLTNDVVNGPDGAVYQVLVDHTSGSTFDPGANDGAGNDYYSLLLAVPASSLPAGGGPGYVLTKATATDYDVVWETPSAPPGGSAGQVLQKNTSTDGDASWNTIELNDIADLSIDATPNDWDYLRWDAATEQWINQQPTTLNVLTASSWSPVTGDDGAFMVLTNSSSDVTITIPSDTDEPFPIGTELHIHQDGTGTVTIDSDSGVALLYHASFTNELLGQYATATVKKTAEDEWRLFGLLALA